MPRNTDTSTYENSNPAMPPGNISSMFSQKTCPINVFRDAPKALRTPSSDTRSCILERSGPRGSAPGLAGRGRGRRPRRYTSPARTTATITGRRTSRAAPLSPVPPASRCCSVLLPSPTRRRGPEGPRRHAAGSWRAAVPPSLPAPPSGIHDTCHRGVGYPRLGVNVGSDGGYILHHAANRIFYIVDQDGLTGYLGTPEQAACQGTVEHHAGHPGKELGTGERLPVQEAETVDLPERVVASHQLYFRRLVATRRLDEDVPHLIRHDGGVGGDRHFLGCLEAVEDLLHEPGPATAVQRAFAPVDSYDTFDT